MNHTSLRVSDFTNYSNQYRPIIDAWLHELFESELPYAESQAYTDLAEQVRVLVDRGGKRLRPLMTLLSYQGYGGTNQAESLPVAAATELLHAFLLIHDDIIDRDFRRWGGPNITAVYLDRYSYTMSQGDALHFAQSQAMLAGDICQNLTQQAILGTDLDADAKVQLLTLFNAVTKQVLCGELADVHFSNLATPPSKDEVLAMYNDKTASYSIVLPLQAGAIMAGAPESELELLAQIGQKLGVAYQLQDDLLGVFGDQSKTGKPPAGDLREGKYTALVLTALELAQIADRQELTAILAAESISSQDIAVAQQIITDSGAQSSVQQTIAELSDQAIQLLNASQLYAKRQSIFEDLIHLLLDREK